MGNRGFHPGLPDPDFGNNGFFLLEETLPGSLFSISLDRQGKIVTSGTCNENSTSGYHLNILRLNSFATGADEMVNEPLIQLTPNPVIDHVTIRLNEPGQFKLTLWSIDGKQVLESELTQKTTAMDLGFLKPGVYFIRVISGDKAETVKIIKQQE